MVGRCREDIVVEHCRRLQARPQGEASDPQANGVIGRLGPVAHGLAALTKEGIGYSCLGGGLIRSEQAQGCGDGGTDSASHHRARQPF